MSRSLHILLVDAESETRAIAERGLSAEGFHVTGCPDEQQALGCCFSGTFDAMMLDLDLLVAGGTQLARRVREHVPYKSLPIIGIAKRPGMTLAPGSGLDLVVEGYDPCRLARALHALRQARGFLAAPQTSPLARYQL